MKIGRRRTKTLAHFLHNIPDDPGGRAPPSRMNGSHRPHPLIGQQDGDAVRGLHRDHGARSVFNQSVARTQNPCAPFRRNTTGGMDLPERGQVGEYRRNIRVARCESMDEPG